MWEVTALTGEEEEDVQKDEGLGCLNIYFCVIPQRANGGDFREASRWVGVCLEATMKEEEELLKKDKDRKKTREMRGMRR